MATPVVPHTYLKLIRRCPLRPIRSDEDLDRAIAMVDTLGARIKELTPDERDYLDVLADLVEKYETARYPEPEVDPLAMIRELIAARCITQADVARETGIAESMLSEILKGKRPMGRKTIETLSRFFHVDPGVFFPDAKPSAGPVAGKIKPSLMGPGSKAASAAASQRRPGTPALLHKGGKTTELTAGTGKPPKSRKS
jgi:HTH-type transcriptional regulator/antitoxin HigA